MKIFSASETLLMMNAILDVPTEYSGLDYLYAFSRNAWEQLGFDYLFLGYALEPDKTRVQTIVAMHNGEIIEDFIYDLADTPCEDVYTGKRVCVHDARVAQAYPKDTMLVDMGVESYIGAPTLVDGKLSGLFAILDSSVITDSRYYQTLIEVLASRVSVEVERVVNQKKIEQLERLATIDTLTEIPNRKYFEEHVSALLARGESGIMLFIDADHFKAINDEHGHQTGDVILKSLSNTLKTVLRSCDYLARYGGEEFIAFLPGVDLDGAGEVIERIHSSVRSIDVDGINITVSIGVTLVESRDSYSAAVERSDRAVYQAKNAGRNRTAFL